MTRVEDRSDQHNSQPGDPPSGNFARINDALIVLCLGYLVPLVSMFRGHWLEYLLPFGLILTSIHLTFHRVTWNDYFKAMPRDGILPIVALIVLSAIAAMRNFEFLEGNDILRALFAPFILYVSFYGVVFFSEIQGTVLARRILAGLFLGGLTALTILAIEPFVGLIENVFFPLTHVTREFAPSHLNRNFMVLAFLCWLPAPFLARRFGRLAFGVVPPIIVWLLSMSGESEMVLVGMMVSIAVFLVALWLPRFALHTTFTVAVVLLLGGPLLYPLIFEFAVNALAQDRLGILVRTEIWDGVARFIAHAPITGYGFQGVKHFGPLEMATLFYPDNRVPHPHNAYLQIWTDMGLLGALAATGILWAMWRALCELANDRLPHLLAIFTIVICAFITTYNLWAAWWLGLLAITFAYCILTRRNGEPAKN